MKIMVGRLRSNLSAAAGDGLDKPRKTPPPQPDSLDKTVPGASVPSGPKKPGSKRFLEELWNKPWRWFFIGLAIGGFAVGAYYDTVLRIREWKRENEVAEWRKEVKIFVESKEAKAQEASKALEAAKIKKVSEHLRRALKEYEERVPLKTIQKIFSELESSVRKIDGIVEKLPEAIREKYKPARTRFESYSLMLILEADIVKKYKRLQQFKETVPSDKESLEKGVQEMNFFLFLNELALRAAAGYVDEAILLTGQALPKELKDTLLSHRTSSINRTVRIQQIRDRFLQDLFAESFPDFSMR